MFHVAKNRLILRYFTIASDVLGGQFSVHHRSYFKWALEEQETILILFRNRNRKNILRILNEILAGLT